MAGYLGRGCRGLVQTLCGLALWLAMTPAMAQELLVFAAASLQDAFDAVIAEFPGKAAPVARPTPRARRWRARSSRARRPTSSSPPTRNGWTTSPSAACCARAAAPICSATAWSWWRRRRATSARDRARASTSPARSTAAGWRWAIPTTCRPASTARRRSRASASGRRWSRRSRAPTMSAPRSRWSPAARRRSASSTAPTRWPTTA